MQYIKSINMYVEHIQRVDWLRNEKMEETGWLRWKIGLVT